MMTKEVQMSIKMEPELRDQFMKAAAATHRPAAQIIRELMRAFVARHEVPNETTIAAIEAAEHGEVTVHESTDALYRNLDI